MLREIMRSVLIAGATIGLSGTAVPGVAKERVPVPEVKILPSKPDERNKPKVSVKTQKGVATGIMSVFGRRSGAAQRDQSWSGASASNQEVSAEDRERFMRECFELTGETSCLLPDDVTANSAGGGLTGALAQAMAVRLVTELRLPTPTPNFGPNPNNNEWKMLAVGFPIWLWTEGSTTVSTSASASGFTFQMTARWQSTTFHMGDGNTVTCTSAEKYSASVKPATPSPNCGYAYSKPSLPKGKYRVRAVADWEVNWSVAGFSGVLPAYNEASASIPIGELVALNR